MEQMMKNTTIVGAEREDLVDSFSSSSLSSSGTLSGSSLESESDSFEEVTSSSSSASPSSSSSADHQLAADPLLDMSSLSQQLPIKRGLSKHYQGKSQSFTSLANVRSLEDLPKPENRYNKKLKSCRRSYGGGFMGETQNGATKSSSSNALSRQISKSSRGSCSSLSVKGASAGLGITSRPPMPPYRSTSTTAITNQTPLFA